jgi:hypothetical protein
LKDLEGGNWDIQPGSVSDSSDSDSDSGPDFTANKIKVDDDEGVEVEDPENQEAGGDEDLHIMNVDELEDK